MCMCLRLLAPRLPFAMAAYEDGSLHGLDLRTMTWALGKTLAQETGDVTPKPTTRSP